MKVSLNWLRELVELPPTVPALVDLLTMAGVEVEGIAKAYPFRELAKAPQGLVQDEVAGKRILVVHELKSGTTRALLCEQATGRLDFEADAEPEMLRETGSGSRFTRFGRAVDGPLKNLQLPLVNSLQAEWYGWYALHPQTDLFSVGSP